MPKFFTDHIRQGKAILTGEDARHVGKSLRMSPGEELVLSDLQGTDYRCVIEQITSQEVFLQVVEEFPCAAEPLVQLRLFMAMSKGDKMELIVQKAVELGAFEIVPVLTSRCISRPDAKSMKAKRERYQKIAQEAAKQSGRGRIPQIADLMEYDTALQAMAKDDCALLFYENADAPLSSLLPTEMKTVSIMIGAEGGFSSEEVEKAKRQGLKIASLGPRILRCETAAITAVALTLFAAGCME